MHKNLPKDYRLLIYSFIVLNLTNWITWVEIRYGIPHIVKYALVFFVLGTIIYYMLTKPAKVEKGELVYSFVLWFIIWTLVLLVLSILNTSSPLFLQRVLADRYFFMPYLLPLLVLFIKFDLNFFKEYFKYSYLFLIPSVIIEIYIIVFAISPDHWLEQMEMINIFNIGSGFLLLTSHYSRNKNISRIVILFYFLNIAFALLNGRRGLVISDLLLIMVFIILRLISPILSFKHRMRMYLIGVLSLTLLIAFGYLITSTYAFERGFGKDAFEESRGLVFIDFFDDFNSLHDWIFGRGIEGRVYRSIYSQGATLDIVEQGFLTIILRGGLLYLIPFAIIFLRAIYLGIFRSRNGMVKALASLIFIHFFMMFSFNLPDFSVYYMVIWISILTCLSSKIRNYSDKDIYYLFNS